MKSRTDYLRDDEPEIVDGYRELDGEGKALVLATVRKLAKDAEARKLAAGFLKIALTPREFQLIMCYRAATAEGKAQIWAAAQAAPKRQEAELNSDDADETSPKRAVSDKRSPTGTAKVTQNAVSTGNLPDAFFSAARKHRSEV